MGDENSPVRKKTNKNVIDGENYSNMVQTPCKRFKVSFQSNSELDLVYHFTTLFKRNSTPELTKNTLGNNTSQTPNECKILTGDVEYSTKSLRDRIRQEHQSNQSIHGTNKKCKNLTDTFRIELLLNVAHCFRHMQEERITHGKLDSSCIYIGVDGKHLAIVDKAQAPQEDLKCLGKLVLHVLSNGKVIDDELWECRSTSESLKQYSEKREVVASELIYVYENLIKKTTTKDDTIQQNDETNSTEKKLNFLHELLDCDEPILAYNLILDKLYASATFSEILCHPFWWSPTKKCQFICAAFGYFRVTHAFGDGYKKEYDDKLREIYGIDGKNVFSKNGWIEELVIDAKAIGVIERNCGVKIGSNTISSKTDRRTKKYRFHENSLYDLMRFFRNCYCHYYEECDDVQHAFGKSTDGFWKFFATRFPNLLQHVYGKLWNEVENRLEFDLFKEPAPESKYLTG